MVGFGRFDVSLNVAARANNFPFSAAAQVTHTQLAQTDILHGNWILNANGVIDDNSGSTNTAVDTVDPPYTLDASTRQTGIIRLGTPRLGTFLELKAQTYQKLSTSVEEEKSKEDWFLEISAREEKASQVSQCPCCPPLAP